MTYKKAIILMGCLFQIGCSSRVEFSNPYRPSVLFNDSKSTIQSGFESFGFYVGAIAAIPIDIIAFPVTYFIVMDRGPDWSNIIIFIGPSIGLGYVTGSSVGTVVYPISGWWNNNRTSAQQGDAPEPASPAR